MKSIALIAASAWLCAACMPEPDVRVESHPPQELDASNLAELIDLEGQWEIAAQISSDCPDQWKRSLPLGKTLWTTDEGRLTIQGSTEGLKIEKLWPIDTRTFEKKLSMEFMGCAGNEELTFIIEENEGGFARGFFSARLTHNGKALCHDLLQDREAPESCETLTLWQARRR